jgi:ssDNA-binding Zn-finger/Zn-ribbon topoisomerase 1
VIAAQTPTLLNRNLMETGSTTPNHPLPGDGVTPAGRQSPDVPFESRLYCSLGFFVGVIVFDSVVSYVEKHILGHVDPFLSGVEDFCIILGLLGGATSLIFSLTVMFMGFWRGQYRFSPLRRTALACAAGVAFLGLRALSLVLLDDLLPGDLDILSLFLMPVLLGVVYVLLTQDRRLSDQPQCPKCGYLLYHAIENRCPECGRSFTLDEFDTGNAVVDSDGVLRPKSERPAEQLEERA